MNDSWRNDRTLDESIDLLVDDELSDQECQQLLQELDVSEEGWRQCALAFLEDRKWTQVASGELRRESDHAVHQQTIPPKRVSRPSLVWWVAIAAAAAFFVGRSSVAPGDKPLADKPAPGGDGGRAVADNPRDSDDSTLVADVPSQGADQGTGQHNLYPTSLLVERGDDRPGFELPVVDFGGQSTDWTRKPPPIPRNVEEAIERMGGEIEREYFFAPAELENGQHVVVPVERLHIGPASHRQIY